MSANDEPIKLDYLLALLDDDTEDSKQRPEHKSYGPQVLLPFDGLVRIRPVDMYTALAKASGNKKFVAVWRVDDIFDGQKLDGILYDHIPYTGTRGDGTPNALKLAKLLRSAGAAIPAGEIEPAAIMDLFMKAEQAFGNVEAQEWQGKWSSKIQEYVTKKRVDNEMLAGTARTPRLTQARALAAAAATKTEPSAEERAQTTQEIKDILGGIA